MCPGDDFTCDYDNSARSTGGLGRKHNLCNSYFHFLSRTLFFLSCSLSLSLSLSLLPELFEHVLFLHQICICRPSGLRLVILPQFLLGLTTLFFSLSLPVRWWFFFPRTVLTVSLSFFCRMFPWLKLNWTPIDLVLLVVFVVLLALTEYRPIWLRVKKKEKSSGESNSLIYFTWVRRQFFFVGSSSRRNKQKRRVRKYWNTIYYLMIY